VERAILVRHAESAASAKGLLNGDPYRYVPLTKTGTEQARRLGERLRGEPIDLCITSRFPRTRETADIALEGRPVPRLVIRELDDVRVGDFEGKPVEELRRWQGVNPPTAEPPGGGESRVESILRYCDAYRMLLLREEPSLLVVTHGLPVTAVLLCMRGEDIPLTLEGVQAEPADPHTVTPNELEGAIQHLREWAARVSSPNQDTGL
jgi:2,3-bisphosphoglycerate-dependent phosphoglycerate mutase